MRKRSGQTASPPTPDPVPDPVPDPTLTTENDVSSSDGLLTCRNRDGLEASEFATRISASDESKVYWFANRGMAGVDANDEERLVYVRIIGRKLAVVNANGDASNVKGRQSTCIDIDDDFTIYFPPTNNISITVGLDACKRKMRYTARHGFLIRVAIIYDERPEIDGVDMGVYKVTDYSAGNGNFMIMHRVTDGWHRTSVGASVPSPASIGRAMTYKNYTYRSRQEVRVAVLLEALGIPFLYENDIDMKVYTPEGTGYEVDFQIYPADKDRVAYLEVKPYKPHRGEIVKAMCLFQRTHVPVFIVWGQHFVQGIGMATDKDLGRDVCPRYTQGIQAMKVYRGGDGRVTYEEGYYFMANDRAEGAVWEEVTGSEAETTSSSDVLPIAHDEVVSYLDRGVLTFGKKKRQRLGLTTRLIRKSTRLVSPYTKKCYRPADGSRAYLYRDALEEARVGTGGIGDEAGMSLGAAATGQDDAFSRETRAAFERAETFRFGGLDATPA